MRKQSNRRRKFFANKMHREIFFLVFWACLLPTIITAVFLFYLIFYITSEQIGIPEAIAYNILPSAQRVTSILLIILPIVIAIILFLSFRLTHRLVGPFDRIVRELDEFIQGKRSARIHIRENDKFRPLVDKINVLLERQKAP